jgi:Ser/Thr protein kinase RdoA (MazF antagonist)
MVAQKDVFDKDYYKAIAAHFTQGGRVTEVRPLGEGNINDTFLVDTDHQQPRSFVLQRLNTQVFPAPLEVIQNVSTVIEHSSYKLKSQKLSRPWQIPQLLVTTQGQAYWQSESEDFWRALSFIEGTQSWEKLTTLEQAQEVGFALATFHSLVSDLNPHLLLDTLVGFHITPQYLQNYQQILGQNPAVMGQNLTPEIKFCFDFIQERGPWCHILETAKAQGKLPLRLMHGDPKINNILIDRQTQRAISMIDLDTVKPGLIHYDLGDCLRSGCNPWGEETYEWQKVAFEPELCRGILEGYLAVAKRFLIPSDYVYLYDAIRLLAFELGLRFFSDYLRGNTYFKVAYPDHNLNRALVQFQLTASIENQERILQMLIQELK